MTRPNIPHTFRTGETLHPRALRENFERLSRNLEDGASERYADTFYVVPLDDLADTDTDEVRQIHVKVSFAYEIVAKEIALYSTDGTELTLSATGVTGWTDLKATGAGAAVRAWNGDELGGTVAAGATVVYQIDGAGTWALANGHAVIHIRTDRHLGILPSFTPPQIDASKLDTAADLNTAFTTLSGQNTNDGNHTSRRRLEVVMFRRDQTAIATTDQDMRLAGYGDRVVGVECFAVGVASNTVTVELYDEAAAQVGTTATMALTGTAAVISDDCGSIDETQGGTDPTDETDDYYLRAAHTVGAGNVDKLYCVVEWEA